MSYGSTQTNRSAKPKRPTPSQGLLAVFRRLRRKATIIVIGAALSFLGMSIAVTDASQSVFQKAIGTATLVILLGAWSSLPGTSARMSTSGGSAWRLLSS